MNFSYITISEACELFFHRKLSPVELTQMCLDRIAALNPQLNAWITVAAESAFAEAHAAEGRMMRDARLSPLDGIPIGLKDNIDTAGMLTTAASNLFRDRIPPTDAVVVRQLRQAGAIILGKLNLHELAYGGSNYVSAFGAVKNPWNSAYLSGGSSGGTAVAVATGMCLAAVGTDTAGSIRVPASCCGVVGLKPTYGIVSTQGVIPLSWSLDHAGPLTQSVEDAARMLDALIPNTESCADALVSASHGQRLLEARARGNARSARLGIPRENFLQDLAPAVASAFKHALDVFRDMDAEIIEVDVPADANRTVQAAESYAYHQRWADLASPDANPEAYHPETLRRIQSGAAITAPQYIHARLAMDDARTNAGRIFSEVDAVITPTSPVLPPTFATIDAAPEQLRTHEIAMLRNTRPFNVLGLPAISVPCGFTAEGLPMSLQIAARHGDEDMVLALGDAYEQTTAWHRRHPKL